MPPKSASTSHALDAAVAASILAKEIGDVFPPAAAAAGVLFLIFHTIKHLKTNQADCYRLARRSLDLLVQMKEQTEGRLDDAPPSLVKNLEKFERVLKTIHERMQSLTKRSWQSRLMNKGDIEKTLEELNVELDNAARSFQISTLINIHYALGERSSSASTILTEQSSSSNSGSSGADSLVLSSSPPRSSSTLVGTIDETHLLGRTATDLSISTISSSEISGAGSSFDIVSPTRIRSSSPHEYGFDKTLSPVESVESCLLTSELSDSLDIGDVDPFADDAVSAEPLSDEQSVSKSDVESETSSMPWQEYHQSQVILQGRSKIKDGWWAGSLEVSLPGKAAVIKRYEGKRDEARKEWLRDLSILKNIQHPNLPILIGYSPEDSPTPFILLAEIGTRALRLFLRDELRISDTSTVVQLLFQLFEDTLDAAQYLQSLLQLSESKAQDYVEHATYRVTNERRILVGLPPVEVDEMITHRQWSLRESVRDVFLLALPENWSDAKQVGSVREAFRTAVQRSA